jgi:hypothetical protein
MVAAIVGRPFACAGIVPARKKGTRNEGRGDRLRPSRSEASQGAAKPQLPITAFVPDPPAVFLGKSMKGCSPFFRRYRET